MGALADNKFNRISDNDLSESVNVIFLIIQHFSPQREKYVSRKNCWRENIFFKHKTSGFAFNFYFFEGKQVGAGEEARRERVYVD